jgi:hypothetical protein
MLVLDVNKDTFTCVRNNASAHPKPIVVVVIMTQ